MQHWNSLEFLGRQVSCISVSQKSRYQAPPMLTFRQAEQSGTCGELQWHNPDSPQIPKLQLPPHGLPQELPVELHTQVSIIGFKTPFSGAGQSLSLVP